MPSPSSSGTGSRSPTRLSPGAPRSPAPSSTTTLAARGLVTAAITRTSGQRQRVQADRDAHEEASWRQRALNAEQALRAAHVEIRAQRTRIGELLGQLRDTQLDHDGNALERLTTDNSTLRQRTRDLTAANRTLEERLQAARSNNRFLDKRIAALEAQLLAGADE